ncbi:hypothetical protein FACUT_8442 [Fusarium acutatum]|uniref:Uncharacterized protein n=1 Tax=Fusarium acutatum TaxID=78861 RepID=A0A8H4JKE9_9HYPO|nr:hypothetical protein FACUT_8442 [Fusarium acutatum]
MFHTPLRPTSSRFTETPQSAIHLTTTMDNKTHVKKDSLSFQDLARQMRRPTIVTPTGLMPLGDASTLQKVPELKAIAIVAGDLLCSLRLESQDTPPRVLPLHHEFRCGGLQQSAKGQREAIFVVSTTYRVIFIGTVASPVTALTTLELIKEFNVFVGQLPKVSYEFKTQAVELTILQLLLLFVSQSTNLFVAPTNR